MPYVLADLVERGLLILVEFSRGISQFLRQMNFPGLGALSDRCCGQEQESAGRAARLRCHVIHHLATLKSFRAMLECQVRALPGIDHKLLLGFLQY